MYFSTTFITLAFVICSASASFLRGLQHIVSHDGYKTFDCDVFELDGMPEPGRTFENRWVCKVDYDENGISKQSLRFNGDVVSKFGDDFESGMTKMTVPLAAVNDSIIDINHPGITISNDHSKRGRFLAAKTGTTKLLIIRVIGSDTQGVRYSPTNWKTHLKNNFFEDASNPKNILAKCSNYQLKLEPAQQWSGQDQRVVTNGIINIDISNMDNIIGLNWQKAGNHALSKLSQIPGLAYDVIAFILPDVVDMEGAAGLAYLNSNKMWIKDLHAEKPIVTVHEYGHLLGARHSGRENDAYGDKTGYMGNKVSWQDDIGTQVCFNAPKLWYFNWFPQYHRTVNPKYSSVNTRLVGINDIVTGTANSNDDLIIKIDGGHETLFVNFNRAKGINADVKGSIDKVVIIRQNSGADDSRWIAEMGHGEEWKSPYTFSNSGKHLVVKNCAIFYDSETDDSKSDTAKVLVYLEGLNDVECGNVPPPPPPPSSNFDNGECQTDYTWHDSGGISYDCYYYENTPNACGWFGHRYAYNGFTANDKCCVCRQ